jgi:hypothetical protein
VIEISWNYEKNEWLKRIRGASFEEIIRSRLFDAKIHPTRKNQTLLYSELNGYVWIVPAVENESGFFLKAAYPSRKATKNFMFGAKK